MLYFAEKILKTRNVIMKRYIALLLVFVMAFALCACGKDNAQTQAEPTAEVKTVAKEDVKLCILCEDADSGYVLAGPKDDPAGVKSAENIKDAFTLIADGRYFFVSLGDGSKLHMLEVAMWPEEYAMSTNYDDIFRWTDWYNYLGTDVANSLITANELEAYIFCDKDSFTKLEDGSLAAAVTPEE